MAKRKKKSSSPHLQLVPPLESNKNLLIDEQAGKELKALIRQINQASARSKASKEKPDPPSAA